MRIEKSYDASYYASEGLEALQSAKVVVPLVTSVVRPKSVVDVGCGLGAWLSVFREHGAERILGLDGSHVEPSWLLIPKDCFHAIDLSQPFRLDEQFDLGVCLEVAEHLPKSSAGGFVESIVGLAPIILFSAAVPQQGGTYHVNEQWPEYWQRLFQRHNYRMLDLVRKLIWKDPRVKPWYRQNAFLFVREDLISTKAEFVEATQYSNDLMLVHSSVLHAQLSLRSILRNLPRSIWEAVYEVAPRVVET